MLLVQLVLIALSLVGHGAFWVGLNNRWHGLGLPRIVIKSVSLAIYALLLGLPLAVAARLYAERGLYAEGSSAPLGDSWAAGYVAICAVLGAIHLPLWARRRLLDVRSTPGVQNRVEQERDVRAALGAAPTSSPRTRLFCALPYNQLWRLRLAEYEVELDGLPHALEGMSICHLSDFHFSPRIDRAYFDEVIAAAGEMRADLVALTGDVCDKAQFIDWIPQTLGRLEAPLAKCYVLGNHDLRTRDVARLRTVMRSAGFLDVAGRVETLSGAPIVVAGNELPWFPDSVPEIESLPSGSLRLLLSHSPDQLAWAERHQFDLMLAGHTHGGQIRFPILGPVVCPSLHGTRYASGFYRGRSTLLHVSRGSGSLFPYRLNCRPEIVKLVLRAKR